MVMPTEDERVYPYEDDNEYTTARYRKAWQSIQGVRAFGADEFDQNELTKKPSSQREIGNRSERVRRRARTSRAALVAVSAFEQAGVDRKRRAQLRHLGETEWKDRLRIFARENQQIMLEKHALAKQNDMQSTVVDTREQVHTMGEVLAALTALTTEIGEVQKEAGDEIRQLRKEQEEEREAAEKLLRREREGARREVGELKSMMTLLLKQTGHPAAGEETER
jgi:hypothetical protein